MCRSLRAPAGGGGASAWTHATHTPKQPACSILLHSPRLLRPPLGPEARALSLAPADPRHRPPPGSPRASVNLEQGSCLHQTAPVGQIQALCRCPALQGPCPRSGPYCPPDLRDPSDTVWQGHGHLGNNCPEEVCRTGPLGAKPSRARCPGAPLWAGAAAEQSAGVRSAARGTRSTGDAPWALQGTGRGAVRPGRRGRPGRQGSWRKRLDEREARVGVSRRGTRPSSEEVTARVFQKLPGSRCPASREQRRQDIGPEDTWSESVQGCAPGCTMGPGVLGCSTGCRGHGAPAGHPAQAAPEGPRRSHAAQSRPRALLAGVRPAQRPPHCGPHRCPEGSDHEEKPQEAQRLC